MEEMILDRMKLRKGYYIDKQFLFCLDDICKKYDPKVKITIEVLCEKVEYKFCSVDEFVKSADTISKIIDRFCFTSTFSANEDAYRINEIKIELNNKEFHIFGGQISFSFNNERDYLLLRNHIEALLKNYRVAYAFFANLPNVPIASTILFVFICYYTNKNSIIFITEVQYLIAILWLLSLGSPFFPFMQKIKAHLLPAFEFRFGVNNIRYKRMQSIRYFIGGTIIAGILVSVIGNIVYNFFLR